MSNPTRKKLEALAEELAKDMRSEDDLSALSRHLVKLTVERSLQAELEEHLGYKKHEAKGRNSGNNRNGHSSKTLATSVKLRSPHPETATALLSRNSLAKAKPAFPPLTSRFWRYMPEA